MARSTAGIADDRHLDLDVLVDRGRVDIGVDLQRFGEKAFSRPVTRSSKRAPMLNITSQPVHRQIGFVGAVHAQHAEELRVAAGIGAQAHQRVGAGQRRPSGRTRQQREASGPAN
jgi:hypothetical protein